MKMLEPGAHIDGFTIGECLHAGGMAHIYRVQYTDESMREPFPMAMKVPRMTGGDGAENIVGFEVERQILPALTGSHVPRFVAAGDLDQRFGNWDLAMAAYNAGYGAVLKAIARFNSNDF